MTNRSVNTGLYILVALVLSLLVGTIIVQVSLYKNPFTYNHNTQYIADIPEMELRTISHLDLHTIIQDYTTIIVNQDGSISIDVVNPFYGDDDEESIKVDYNLSQPYENNTVIHYFQD